jgi:hypothetical protein
MTLTLIRSNNKFQFMTRGLAGAAGAKGEDGIGYLGARERPGDVKEIFTSSLTGSAGAQAPLTVGTSVANEDGQVLRYVASGPGPGVIASRQDMAAEPTPVYVVRFAVRRAVNTSDPLGDAIEFGLSCMNANKQVVSTRILETFNLATADGRKSSQFTYSRDADVDADITLSATTRYVRPFVRIYGGDGTTDVEVIGKWETNGLPGPKGDTGDLTPAAEAARAEVINALENITATLNQSTALAPLDYQYASYAPFATWLTQTGTNGFIYAVGLSGQCFQDAAGTVPVTAVGQVVKRINDPSGRGNHLVRSHATINCTMQIDSAGLYYIDVPAGAFLTTADGVGTTGTISFTSAYIGVAVTRTVEESGNLFGVATDAANGIFIQNTINSAIIQPAAFKTGFPIDRVLIRAGSAPLRLPTAIDLLLVPGALSSWINGGYKSLTTEESGTTLAFRETVPAVLDGITNGYIGISANGRTSANRSCRFYGALGAFAPIPQNLRAANMRWLRDVSGQSYVDANFYDVFLIAGQSNAQGADSDGSLAPVVPRGKAGHYMDTGFLRPMAEPTQHITNSVSLTGSAWSAFCLQWNARTARTAAIIGAAASGCGLIISGTAGNWGPSSTLTDRAVAKWREGVDHINATTRGSVTRGVIYAGGEQDVGGLQSGSTTIAAYKALLVGLRDRFRAKTGIPALPLYLISPDRQTVSTNDLGYSRLRQAVAEAAAENEGIELVVPYQDFVGQGKMGSTTHWNQVALNEVGTISANKIADLLGF